MSCCNWPLTYQEIEGTCTCEINGSGVYARKTFKLEGYSYCFIANSESYVYLCYRQRDISTAHYFNSHFLYVLITGVTVSHIFYLII